MFTLTPTLAMQFANEKVADALRVAENRRLAAAAPRRSLTFASVRSVRVAVAAGLGRISLRPAARRTVAPCGC